MPTATSALRWASSIRRKSTKSSLNVSVIIPTLNEEDGIRATLDAVLALSPLEVIVVDGGSTDRTLALARSYPITVLESPKGRGLQLHTGAQAARGDVLWFLHADTQPCPEALSQIRTALKDPRIGGGNFSLHFDRTGGQSASLLTWLYPRFRYLGLCYGDASIFLRRELYAELGGFQPYPIFEDLDLIRRLRRRSRFVHLPGTLTTSSRRFAGRSFSRTFARWVAMQILFWAGVHPNTLGRYYRDLRRSTD